MFISALSLFSSCAEESGLSGGEGRPSDGTVRIKAAISPGNDTRAYQDQGDIIEGTFYLTYPNYADNKTYSVSTVSFNNGYGVPVTDKNLELKWQDIGTLTYDDDLTVFWLDNVPKPLDDPNATEIVFTDAYNPFVASVFDNVLGTNDLLWGYQNPKIDGTQDIEIGIHHYMSRVSVIVTVDNSNENAEKINFREGTVTLTNVIHKAESYNRTNGTLYLGPEPRYENLVLCTGGDDWGDIWDDEEETDITYFQTKNFVLPPQTLKSDETRPRLILNVPQSDGSTKSYSGVLPRIMTVNGTPATLAFNAENNLTLKVKLSQNLEYIEAIYAFVQDWVDKGTHTVIASQAGVYSSEQLMSLVEAYNKYDIDELIHYGYMNNSDWIFGIFADLTLNEEDITGIMPIQEGHDFSFDLSMRTLTVTMSDGSVVSYTADQSKEAAAFLKALMTGTKMVLPEEPDPGSGDNAED